MDKKKIIKKSLLISLTASLTIVLLIGFNIALGNPTVSPPGLLTSPTFENISVNSDVLVGNDVIVDASIVVGETAEIMNLDVIGTSNLKGNVNVGTADDPKAIVTYGPFATHGKVIMTRGGSSGYALQVIDSALIEGSLISRQGLFVRPDDDEDNMISLTSDGAADFKGRVVVGSELKVQGETYIGTRENPKNLRVEGTSELKGDVNIGTSTSNKNLTVNGESRLEGLVVIGSASVPGSMFVNGTSIFRGDTDIGTIGSPKNFTAWGLTQLRGDVHIGIGASPKNLTVNGQTNLEGKTNLKGDVEIGTSLTPKNLTVHGDLTAKSFGTYTRRSLSTPVVAGRTQTVSISCNSGEILVSCQGNGASVNDWTLRGIWIDSISTTCYVSSTNNSSGLLNLNAIAICLDPSL